MESEPPTVLTSLSNAKVKHMVRMRNNRARRKAGSVLVDGWRETAQALAAGYQLREVFYVDPSNQDTPAETTIRWRDQVMEHQQVARRTQWVSPAVLEKIGYGETQRGVVAEFDRPVHSIQQLALDPLSICLVLDRLEKPGNVGAIFRTAEAAGIDAVLLCGGGDPLHPNAIRASSGGVFHVPWAIADEPSIVQFLLSHDAEVLAARVESAQPLWSVEVNKTLAIVLGNEAEGLQDRWMTIHGQLIPGVQIPMAGEVDSLNVSVTAALIAFHATRERAKNQR